MSKISLKEISAEFELYTGHYTSSIQKPEYGDIKGLRKKMNKWNGVTKSRVQNVSANSEETFTFETPLKYGEKLEFTYKVSSDASETTELIEKVGGNKVTEE